MTPAIRQLQQQAIEFELHAYHHHPLETQYGNEAVEKLGLPAQLVFKTLLVAIDGDNKRLAVAVTPVALPLDLKRVAHALGHKKVEMAEASSAERTTGYKLGGISPLGQKKSLPTLIDASALALSRLYISAGKRGLEMSLSPRDLVALTNASFADIAKHN